MVTLRAAAAVPVGMVAHQGGWDEILLVAGPIAVIVGLLLLARRRVEGGATAAGNPADPPTSGQSTSGQSTSGPPRG